MPADPSTRAHQPSDALATGGGPVGASTAHRLPVWPALDGLRGLAVLAVLAYHHDPELVPGGFLGVSLFFTLSGFLITSLLLTEHRHTGSLDLRRFWSRRIRRLLPMALIGLAVATAVVAWTYPPDARGGPLGEMLAALANVTNWFLLDSGTTYGAQLEGPSPVAHYWSLAVEEQFYFIFPLIAAGALRAGRRGLAGVAVALTAVSVTAALLIDDPNREYLGSDTRAVELLAGVLLAMVLFRLTLRHGTAGARRSAADVAGGIALALTAGLWMTTGLGDGWLYQGGLGAVALVSAVLIGGAIHGPRVAACLSTRPLVGLGRRSYGIYVLHLPVFILLDQNRTGLEGGPLLAVRVVTVVLLAHLCLHLIENPVRFGAPLPGRQGPAAYLTATAAAVVIVVAVSAVADHERHQMELAAVAPFNGSAPPAGAVANQEAAGIPVVLPAEGPLSTVVPPNTEAPAADLPEPPASPASTSTAGSETTIPSPPPTTGPPEPVPVTPLRIAVVGDSTARENGAGMQEWAARSGLAEVRVASTHGSSVMTGDAVRIAEDWIIEDVGDPVFGTDAWQLLDLQPDVLVVFVGNLQLSDWRLSGPGLWRGFGDPVYDGHYVSTLDRTISELEGAGVPILWADMITPDWRLDQNQDAPEDPGEATMNNADRTARMNELTARVLADRPLVRQIDYARIVGPMATDPTVRPDGLHLDPGAFADIMEQAFYDEIRAKYLDIVDAGLPAHAGSDAHLVSPASSLSR